MRTRPGEGQTVAADEVTEQPPGYVASEGKASPTERRGSGTRRRELRGLLWRMSLRTRLRRAAGASRGCRCGRGHRTAGTLAEEATMRRGNEGRHLRRGLGTATWVFAFADKSAWTAIPLL